MCAVAWRFSQNPLSKQQQLGYGLTSHPGCQHDPQLLSLQQERAMNLFSPPAMLYLYQACTASPSVYFPPLSSRSEQVCLESSRLLHMHLTLACTRFNYYYCNCNYHYHYYYHYHYHNRYHCHCCYYCYHYHYHYYHYHYQYCYYYCVLLDGRVVKGP